MTTSPIKFGSESLSFSVAIGEALLAFACKDFTRFTIHGVGIDDEANLGATDGHTAVRFFGCDPGGTQPMDYVGSVWRLDYVTAQVKVAKALKCDVSLAWDKRTVDAKFPALSKVMPWGEIKCDERIGMNAAYLARLAKVAKAVNTSGEVILTTATDPLGPVGFRVEGNDFAAQVAIMPMRVAPAARTSLKSVA